MGGLLEALMRERTGRMTVVGGGKKGWDGRCTKAHKSLLIKWGGVARIAKFFAGRRNGS